MNIEETKKAIEVMQAFVDGKEVQGLGLNETNYDDVSFPSWSWGGFPATYRIKPAEPKEIWVNEYPDGSGLAYTSEKSANGRNGGGSGRKAVHYREVIEE